jgi:hypothetical protein
MKKFIFAMFISACMLVILPAHTSVKTPVSTTPGVATTYKVGIQLVGSNGLPANGSFQFYYYATNAVTGQFYEFDDREHAFFLPAGTYYIGGQDGTGSGWCGVSTRLVKITCNTTVNLTVWCE